jgi:L-fuconolactonase
MVIDAHHHFWRYSDEEYGWIPPDWSALRRDFLPHDLARELSAAGVDGVISVQARQSLAETEWLLDLAAQNEFVRAVVGWAPLIASDLEAHLDRLAAHPAALAGKLRAFRHVLQGEPDDSYMLRDDFNRGTRALTRRGLAYDILIFERHLPNTVAFVDRHPNQIFVVDHIAKPRISSGELEPWAKNLRELARRPNVACKLSGMVTEADVLRWTPGQLRPYFEVVLEAFGTDRLLFGSDWPVCLSGVGYADWKKTVSAALAGLNSSELSAVFGGNAARIYRLP